MLCMICRTKIETAYNDLCFSCYKKEKMERLRAEGRMKYGAAQ